MTDQNQAKHILIITDDWLPNVTGVVRTLSNVKAHVENLGHRVSVIYPDPEKFVTARILPGHPEITLALWPKSKDAGVARQLEKLEPDLIYIATPEGPLGLAAALACRKEELNYTSGFHTKFPEFAAAFHVPGAMRYGYEYLKWAHGPAHRIMTPEGMITELKARGFKNLVPWTRGVNTDLFKPGPSRIYDHLSHPIFLNVGRVSYEKGLEQFLAAELPGTKVVVGDGPLLQELKVKYPKVVFTGVKHGEELAEHYRGADVFAFPSTTDTFGNVQIEALASGLPVAARVNPASAKILSAPGVGAMNTAFQAACLEALKLKEGGCEDACRQHVMKNYNGWEKTSRLLLENLTEAKGPRRSKPIRSTLNLG
ncbi:MAG: glycosyltransferase family 1 protein [Pseudomonadota bacterium]|nr:glycosyltransferase family 1 protein [Pseudomonadota bacterium]